MVLGKVIHYLLLCSPQFINDSARYINSLNLGTNIDAYKVSILFYADDIVIIANCEKELQLILNAIDNRLKNCE